MTKNLGLFRNSGFFLAGILVLGVGLVICWGVPAIGNYFSSSGTSPPETEIDEPPVFKDVTKTSRVLAAYRNGEESGNFAILEALGGGVALFDYDGDGLIDILVTGGGYFKGTAIHGHSCKLFKNLGNWKFKDVTRKVGLDKIRFYTHGCAVADYDCDGWPDLLLTGWGRLALLRNVSDGKGGRRFVDMTHKAKLHDPSWSTSAAWADLDGDGYPDLYVCHYVNWSFEKNHQTCIGFDGKRRDVCPPANFDAMPHKLFRNNGDGTFSDVSKEAGLRLNRSDKDYGKGLGVIAVDVNNDGKPDIYVTNDMTDNFLYLNESTPGKIRLREIGLDSGVARDHLGAPNGSMGVAAGDYDGSGRPSLFVTNYEQELHALYRNDCRRGRVFFEFRTQDAGLAAIGRSFVGWGTGFLDLENDGWLDLVFVNGHPNHFPRANSKREQRPVLMRNQGKGRFQDISSRAGNYFHLLHNARGLAIGDLDNDGKPDIVISHVNEPVVLLRNVLATDNHWLGIKLVGRKKRTIVGARATLEVGGKILARFVIGGGSYASSPDERLLFGLGSATRVGKLTVQWPFGKTETWPNLSVDKYRKIEEGRGVPFRARN